ncbi:MAG: isocitrate lyase/PEP mutase family protein [Lentisphaerae bacterium]|nr:isocitrate lyase/PEP mutase family protein [Lentisphaerota bacterium]
MAKNGLRDALEAGTFVVAPGCYDALSARVAEEHGFGAVYMSGLAVTASLLARPDLELLGMAEMVRQAELIASAVSIPVIADADTGYGGLSNVDRTVQAYQQAGVAAIHIEDQASPKRCGQTGGVRLIEAEAMAAKLRVAVEARGDGGMLIIGRTDAFRVNGADEAIRRVNLYAETGVDLLFVDGVSLPEDFRRIREGVRGRLVGSIVEVDAPARTRAEDLKAMGYSVAIHPISSILATAGALHRLMAGLRASGDTRQGFDQMMTYQSLNALLGIERYHRMWDGTDGAHNGARQ